MSSAPIPGKSLRAKVQEHRAQLGLAVRVTIAAVLAFALSHLVFVGLVTRTVARIRLTGKMANDHLVCPPPVSP
jgi:hypothetical protein